MDTDPALTDLRRRGGIAYAKPDDDTILAALPIDGEWVTGYGPSDLASIIDAIVQSDGLAQDHDGIRIVPHLSLDDVLAYVEDEGQTTILVGPATA